MTDSGSAKNIPALNSINIGTNIEVMDRIIGQSGLLLLRAAKHLIMQES